MDENQKLNENYNKMKKIKQNQRPKSKLFFVPDYDKAKEKGIEFVLDIEGRDGWLIHDQQGKPFSMRVQNVYKDALIALTLLSPFSCKISMKLNQEKEHLFLSRLAWGGIYLDDELITTFSHDARIGKNTPFVSLLEWPVSRIYDLGGENKEADLKEMLAWSSVENWVNFFKCEIVVKARIGLEKVEKNKIATEKILNRSMTIYDALVRWKNTLNTILWMVFLLYTISDFFVLKFYDIWFIYDSFFF